MIFVGLTLKINTEIMGIIMERQHLRLQIPDQPKIRVRSHYPPPPAIVL